MSISLVEAKFTPAAWELLNKFEGKLVELEVYCNNYRGYFNRDEGVTVDKVLADPVREGSARGGFSPMEGVRTECYSIHNDPHRPLNIGFSYNFGWTIKATLEGAKKIVNTYPEVVHVTLTTHYPAEKEARGQDGEFPHEIKFYENESGVVVLYASKISPTEPKMMGRLQKKVAGLFK